MSSTNAAPPPPPAGSPPMNRSAEQKPSVPIGRVVLVIAGALIALMALTPTVGGAFLLWANATHTDADGYYSSPTERLETTSYAITSEKIDLGAEPTGERTRYEFGEVATIRIEADSTKDSALFVGVGPTSDVDRYLRNVDHAVVTDVEFEPFSVDYRYKKGGAPDANPGDQDFWIASKEGTGEQRLEWELGSGTYSMVIMNADGSAGVSTELALAAKSPWVVRVGVALLVFGALGLVFGAALLVIGVVLLARGSHIDLAAVQMDGRTVSLEGELDPDLSRWLWLVKWLLLIPHFIVLAVLWIAFSVVTFIAFVAILFTKRYPRSLFEFNVGVLRWTWRVLFYGYSALGTDRYPPFTLGAEPDYPATLAVAYPTELSRGLVLVKWWLLAIPHLIVVGIIAGGVGYGPGDGPKGGLIGLLVIIAGLALLFIGRYPRGLFSFVMGLNRWVFRVIAYVTLLRDEYPPFRLDQGPTEPEA